MPQPAVLLDTDILSELLKQHPLVVQRVRNCLAEHQRLAFSIITRYELLRGLKAKQARTQEAAFTLLCQASLILPITDQVVERAATLYGDLHRQGALLPDADLLIAATALETQRPLITNNLAHFQRIAGLSVENWKRSA
ncbi:MAG: type II toxin-antitoxin system VapC family toxin [Nitrospira sp.]|jgi:tRNA(fMet)-specific endonuclease VapC|uniref:type II toxin-antitoxin system VapC family toxin n=1 Tax=Nitrospira sp. ND1 TaxID=1658518 RepID=UPI0009B9626A|nr:type II toxin-antitoxin system VapC family toxin [Nitrospira sp. ND1]MBK7419458.1 type II toxin-antitoxin system VapC family toxin [Nitrospira sp.]OYT24143.1 MAG: VapC toxin family PIN domain ribonuclease [Nitrospira sp. UW-LDO-02]MBK7487335.1 type II toxin-antitoxin system VapC family toxin [Nitrospira sp.]MBK8378654.1 type II toxin-antitoxin system VapC family toxin [Nitrospira sp.]MBK9996849.1 type II toxin-antitoxin system VapC family toxin [Nitrospira sp.]